MQSCSDQSISHEIIEKGKPKRDNKFRDFYEKMKQMLTLISQKLIRKPNQLNWNGPVNVLNNPCMYKILKHPANKLRFLIDIKMYFKKGYLRKMIPQSKRKRSIQRCELLLKNYMRTLYKITGQNIQKTYSIIEEQIQVMADILEKITDEMVQSFKYGKNPWKATSKQSVQKVEKDSLKKMRKQLENIRVHNRNYDKFGFMEGDDDYALPQRNIQQMKAFLHIATDKKCPQIYGYDKLKKNLKKQLAKYETKYAMNTFKPTSPQNNTSRMQIQPQALPNNIRYTGNLAYHLNEELLTINQQQNRMNNIDWQNQQVDDFDLEQDFQVNKQEIGDGQQKNANQNQAYLPLSPKSECSLKLYNSEVDLQDSIWNKTQDRQYIFQQNEQEMEEKPSKLNHFDQEKPIVQEKIQKMKKLQLQKDLLPPILLTRPRTQQEYMALLIYNYDEHYEQQSLSQLFDHSN